MGLQQTYTRTVSVMRIGRLLDGTSAYSTTILSVPCHIQPLEEGLSQDLQGNFGKDFLMVCDVVDIKEGDRLVDGSLEYHVNAVDVYDFEGSAHMELRIRTSNN